MKVILEFDDEKDDFRIHKTYIKAIDMSVALWEITQLLRSKLKYESDKFSDQTYTEIEKIRDDVHGIINKHDLDGIVNN